MIRITQLRLPVAHTETDLRRRAAGILRVPEQRIESLSIVRRSLDARKKDQLRYVYTVDVAVSREERVLRRAGDPRVSAGKEAAYRFPPPGPERMRRPPIIIGSGPAGLFCAYMLARAGYRPVILEQGEDADSRREKVERFWRTGELDIRSNVQFGEGGAGTFSDGKLNTLVKDPAGRSREVLRILAEHGADPSVLYESKPHIGTDRLGEVVKNIRRHITDMGGRAAFGVKVTDLDIEDGQVRGVRIACRAETAAAFLGGLDCRPVPAPEAAGAPEGSPSRRTGPGRAEPERSYVLPAEQVVLAVGHSARDTFEMLLRRGVPMQPKSFAVGLRIQHPQKMIDEARYGFSGRPLPGPADYKVTHQTVGGRGVYSFCMCPGGYVVNASSEEGGTAVNGMSNHDRAGASANSAIIVTVTPEDFTGETGNGREERGGAPFPPDERSVRSGAGAAALAGVEYQRRLERLAFREGRGGIPVQLYGDFKAGRLSAGWGDVSPAFRGEVRFANLREILPSYLSDSIIEGVEAFEKTIRGFSRPDSILAGVESRTSSPVRIPRDGRFESGVRGLYPCGEGAGYAGGITSAAMDGMKAAEAIAERYRPV